MDRIAEVSELGEELPDQPHRGASADDLHRQVQIAGGERPGEPGHEIGSFDVAQRCTLNLARRQQEGSDVLAQAGGPLGMTARSHFAFTQIRQPL